jgi:hypothetical protein
MGVLIASDAEVIGFDVSMHIALVVDVLDCGDHLVKQHQYGFEGELVLGVIEQCPERLTHQIHHQHIIMPLFRRQVPSVEQ